MPRKVRDATAPTRGYLKRRLEATQQELSEAYEKLQRVYQENMSYSPILAAILKKLGSVEISREELVMAASGPREFDVEPVSEEDEENAGFIIKLKEKGEPDATAKTVSSDEGAETRSEESAEAATKVSDGETTESNFDAT